MDDPGRSSLGSRPAVDNTEQDDVLNVRNTKYPPAILPIHNKNDTGHKFSQQVAKCGSRQIHFAPFIVSAVKGPGPGQPHQSCPSHRHAHDASPVTRLTRKSNQARRTSEASTGATQQLLLMRCSTLDNWGYIPNCSP